MDKKKNKKEIYISYGRRRYTEDYRRPPPPRKMEGMMTRGETGKLLNTLLRWYPQAKQLRGDTARIQDAWFDALEDFDYAEILETAKEWYQGPKGRYCPDPRELMPQPQETPPDRTAETWLRFWLDSYRSIARAFPTSGNISRETILERLHHCEQIQPQTAEMRRLIREGYEMLEGKEAVA